MPDDDPKKKIVDLFKNGTRKKRTPAKPKGGDSVSVSGNGNVVAGGDVHYHEAGKPPPRGKIQPGVDHITLDQRKTLKRLVEEIAETEARLKKNPKTFAAVFSALFRQFDNVNKLEQIPLAGFETARAYLNQRLGQLNAMPSAPVKNADEWRKRKYAFIKINAKAPEDEAKLKSYISRNFKAASLTDLANDELEKAYRYVAGLRNRRR